jgi:hypothetical protein
VKLTIFAHRIQIAGRVLVDPMGFVSENPLFRDRLLTSEPLRPGPPDTAAASQTQSQGLVSEPLPLNTDELEEDDLICFPATIPGYSLTTKHSGFFHVGAFSDVTWEELEAEKLFSSSSKMKAVHNIISGFSYGSSSFGYSIAGKGRGLVFLFYGPSGTGKTLTAGM